MFRYTLKPIKIKYSFHCVVIIFTRFVALRRKSAVRSLVLIGELLIRCSRLFDVVKSSHLAMSETGDRSWGHLADTELFGRSNGTSEYAVVTDEKSAELNSSECTQAAHCMIYSKFSDKVFGIYNPRAAILMQMRFDGYIGFPGGLVDDGEDVITGLNRELIEEMNICDRNLVHKENHVVTHWSEKKRLLLHFYAVEVAMNEFLNIEKNSLGAHDFGTEVLGILRVPLYTMGDGYRGFPSFINNSFSGNSREQLLYTLQQRQLMTGEEIQNALNAKAVTV